MRRPVPRLKRNASRRGNEADRYALLAEHPPRYLGGYFFQTLTLGQALETFQV